MELGPGLPLLPPGGWAGLVKTEENADADGGCLLYTSTDLKPGSELFQIVTVEAGEDAADFCRRAKAQAAAQTEFITSGPWDGDQLVYFTCLPWFRCV